MPVTTPEALTDAIALLLLAHVPPVVPSVSVAVLPVQVEGVPVMVPADARLLTVNDWVTVVVPQVFVTE